MALAERHLAAEFGDDLVNHYTYAICGDGCLMEGISHEAISLAGHLRLNKLILLWDDNSITIDGSTSLSVSDDQIERFRAHGWAAERVDGLNHDEVAAAIRRAQTHDRPSLIACKTIIAFGAPTKAGTAAAHGSPLGADEIKARQGAAGLGIRAVRRPRRCARRMAAGRVARVGRAAGMGTASRGGARRQAGRVRAPLQRRVADRDSTP